MEKNRKKKTQKKHDFFEKCRFLGYHVTKKKIFTWKKNLGYHLILLYNKFGKFIWSRDSILSQSLEILKFSNGSQKWRDQ